MINNFKAKMKTFENACMDSQLVEDGIRRRQTKCWKLWHPFGKNLTVREPDLDMFGKQVTVAVRDIHTTRKKETKTIYNIFYKGKQMTGYDYWFVWIDDGKAPVIVLEEDLFEI